MADYALGFYLADPDAIWDGDTQAWDLDGSPWNSAGPTNSKLATVGYDAERIFAFERGELLDNGKPLTATFEKRGIQIGDPDQVTYMAQIWVSADGAAGAQFQVQAGGTDQGPDVPVYGAPVTMDVGSDRYVTLEAAGRYLALKFTSLGAADFRVNQFRIKYRKAGRYAA
jgi:hypothetical protein